MWPIRSGTDLHAADRPQSGQDYDKTLSVKLSGILRHRRRPWKDVAGFASIVDLLKHLNRGGSETIGSGVTRQDLLAVVSFSTNSAGPRFMLDPTQERTAATYGHTVLPRPAAAAAATAPQSTAPTTVALKIELDGDVRRFRIELPENADTESKLSLIESEVRLVYKLAEDAALILKYFDDEGDLCTLVQQTLTDYLDDGGQAEPDRPRARRLIASTAVRCWQGSGEEVRPGPVGWQPQGLSPRKSYTKSSDEA